VTIVASSIIVLSIIICVICIIVAQKKRTRELEKMEGQTQVLHTFELDDKKDNVLNLEEDIVYGGNRARQDEVKKQNKMDNDLLDGADDMKRSRSNVFNPADCEDEDGPLPLPIRPGGHTVGLSKKEQFLILWVAKREGTVRRPSLKI